MLHRKYPSFLPSLFRFIRLIPVARLVNVQIFFSINNISLSIIVLYCRNFYHMFCEEIFRHRLVRMFYLKQSRELQTRIVIIYNYSTTAYTYNYLLLIIIHTDYLNASDRTF